MNRAEIQEKNEKKALISEEILFSGRVFDLRRKSLIFPDESKKVFEWIDHPGAVVILPITSEGKMLLIKQWRRAPGEILYEFPAGTLEENESPEHCALRELQEETGYKGDIKFLSKFYSSPGFTNELLFLYLAKNLVKSPLSADDTESIDLIELTLEQTLQMIDEGVIQDAKTICALYFYLRASYA